jgi:glycosyltransferase 2 family protein
MLGTRRGRVGILLALLAAVVGILAWRTSDLHLVGRGFGEVEWRWVAAAIGLNLLSVQVRAIAWHIVVDQAVPGHHLRHRYVFSAFCVGLLGNAALPGRVGEVARIAVLSRRMPAGGSTWAPIFGSVFAHRLFDVIPTVGLVAFVIVTARIPNWAVPGVWAMVGIGAILLLAGFGLAWRYRHGHRVPEGIGRVRALLHHGLRGLRVLHAPGPACAAAFFQFLGWTAQILAVWAAFRAFQIEEPLAAAGLVLLVVNVALAFPLWPGSVGLFQAGVALALLPYGIRYDHGFAYGIGLQLIEVSVGVGLGLLFLAREGISFAMLKQIPRPEEEIDEPVPEPRVVKPGRRRTRPRVVRSRVPERASSR